MAERPNFLRTKATFASLAILGGVGACSEGTTLPTSSTAKINAWCGEPSYVDPKHHLYVAKAPSPPESVFVCDTDEGKRPIEGLNGKAEIVKQILNRSGCIYSQGSVDLLNDSTFQGKIASDNILVKESKCLDSLQRFGGGGVG